jgi:hypothetical protein
VLQLANRKLKPDYVLINLIGDDVTTSLDITHYKLELKRANLAFRTYAPLVKHYCKSKAIVCCDEFIYFCLPFIHSFFFVSLCTKFKIFVSSKEKAEGLGMSPDIGPQCQGMSI